MPRVSFNISVPAEMAQKMDEAMQREHRTRSELVREALRVYFAMTGRPAYAPTEEEQRAIARGRAELQRGRGITLKRLHAELDGLDRAASREKSQARGKTRTRRDRSRSR